MHRFQLHSFLLASSDDFLSFGPDLFLRNERDSCVVLLSLHSIYCVLFYRRIMMMIETQRRFGPWGIISPADLANNCSNLLILNTRFFIESDDSKYLKIKTKLPPEKKKSSQFIVVVCHKIKFHRSLFALSCLADATVIRCFEASCSFCDDIDSFRDKEMNDKVAKHPVEM